MSRELRPTICGMAILFELEIVSISAMRAQEPS